MQHLKDGDPLKVVIVTDGAFGRGEGAVSYALKRRQETLDASKILGYEDLLFWGLPDRGVIFDDELVRRVGFEVDAPSWWEIHPDHSALSHAVTQAVKERVNRLKLVLYEVGVPLHANVLLDITDILETKRLAIGSLKVSLKCSPMTDISWRSMSLGPTLCHLAFSQRRPIGSSLRVRSAIAWRFRVCRRRCKG